MKLSGIKNDVQTLSSLLGRVQSRAELTFDGQQNILMAQDASGTSTCFQFDDEGRLCVLIQPMGEKTLYLYNNKGLPFMEVRPSGICTKLKYDENNRLVRIEYFKTKNTRAAEKVVQFEYNDCGDLIFCEDGNCSLSFSYDQNRRLTGETLRCGAVELSGAYSYDALGRKKSFSGPDGRTAQYTYSDPNGLVMRLPEGGVIGIHEDKDACLRIFPNGIQDMEIRDSQNRPLLIKAAKPTCKPVMDMAFSYDNFGRIVSKFTPYEKVEYSYDAFGRLKTAEGKRKIAFNYDEAGNRVVKNGTASLFDINNRLLKRGNTRYAYDNDGNRTFKDAQGTITRYAYDISGRLRAVSDCSGQLIAKYAYDPLGRRIYKEIGGRKTFFFYSDEGLVAEADADGAVTKTYGYIPDSAWGTDPVYMQCDGRVYFYHNDHMGTPQAMSNENGDAVWIAHYEPFGKTDVKAAKGFENPLRFPGQYHDAETGLHYNMHRYYDPETGRYLRQDPIGFADGDLDLYGYAGANPVNLHDRFGLYSSDELLEDVSNFSAGFGDLISFGLTSAIRDNIDEKIWGFESVDKDSGAYLAGEVSGIAFSMSSGFAGGAKAAGAAGRGLEFSHWIPARMNGPRSLLNGNYVTIAKHALSDPHRWDFLPKIWRNSRQQAGTLAKHFIRFPNTLKGVVTGALYGGTSSAVNNAQE
ncbi:MAG: RHS domain-containing protein [Desulfatibacillum sp.]|nr:RHS domain-containing protein [Desulfatibacillum sp.]